MIYLNVCMLRIGGRKRTFYVTSESSPVLTDKIKYSLTQIDIQELEGEVTDLKQSMVSKPSPPVKSENFQAITKLCGIVHDLKCKVDPSEHDILYHHHSMEEEYEKKFNFCLKTLIGRKQVFTTS